MQRVIAPTGVRSVTHVRFLALGHHAQEAGRVGTENGGYRRQHRGRLLRRHVERLHEHHRHRLDSQSPPREILGALAHLVGRAEKPRRRAAIEMRTGVQDRPFRLAVPLHGDVGAPTKILQHPGWQGRSPGECR